MPALASFYDHSSLVSSLTYGNGSTKSYVYDDQQRIKQTYVDNTLTSLYNYDRLGNLVKYSDAKTGITWNHEYDLIGRATRSDASDGRYIGYTYDSFNRLYTVKENVRGHEFRTVYDYDDQCNYSEKSGLVTGLTMNNSRQFVYSYDKLNRLTSKTLLKNTGFKTSYSYLEGAAENTTTALIKSVNNDGELLEYAYDENGNITSIKKNGALLESYEYDALNQLTKVTRGSEVYTYTYDNAGNILSVKKNGAVIKTYGYSDPEWKDLLTSFNGQTITYDAIGNPLTYRGGMTMTWQSGRQLASINKDGLSATFAYDANGHRTQKTVNGVTTNYYWVGDRLQYMATGDDLLVFLYDDKGTPYGMFTVLDGVQQYFFYLYNAQGDVIAIIDDYAERVVNYEYSAWGELLSVTGSKADTVGVLNPFRYRGYCYDTETGLYYLNSRYYDPTTQRFVNGDGYASTGQGILGNNMFAYCLNNPIYFSDYSGYCAIAWSHGVAGPCPGPYKKGCMDFYAEFIDETIDSMILTNEMKDFLSVIAGEAIGSNTKTQEAVAHTIMNRVKEPRDVWRNATTVSEVLIPSQYNAVGSVQYNKCMEYLDNRDGRNQKYESLIHAAIPIYLGISEDFTGGAHYIFNVNGSAKLLKDLESNPKRYVKCGPFDGISDTEYRMYRCCY